MVVSEALAVGSSSYRSYRCPRHGCCPPGGRPLGDLSTTAVAAAMVVAGQVLHDDEYAFDHQAFIPFEPITLEPGDKVTTECTWKNTTTQTVTWDESSTSEMCFSILYRYPAQGSGAGLCNK